MDKYYKVTGMYLDDNISEETFTDYIVCEADEFVPNNLGITDEDVFYYGLSRKEAEESIGITDHFVDFVLFSVSDYEEE